MSPAAFYRLCFATLAAVIAAVALWLGAPSYSADKAFGQKLAPDLLEKINDIAVMSVEHAGETTTFVKGSDGNWFLMEASGYIADRERIRNALIGLANLEKIEPKTALPEYYPDIQVEDAGPNAQSYLVTLLNANGETLLHLLVGKSTSGIRWNGQGYYVRKPDEARSWLVRGAVDVTGDALTWMDTELSAFKESDIASVTIVDSSKKREATYKRADRFSKMQPVSASDNYFLKSAAFVDGMTKALSTMNFTAVERRPSDWDKIDPYLSVMVETYDGLTQYFFVYLINDVPFAAFSFRSADSASDTVKNYAAALQKGFAAWIYRIPAEKVASISPFYNKPAS